RERPPKDDKAGPLAGTAMTTATAAAPEQGFDSLGLGHPPPPGDRRGQ
ncbi:hypothetical protein SAMN05421580_109228, partial [Rhodobacter aestuarii]